jgi:hypothetical protein
LERARQRERQDKVIMWFFNFVTSHPNHTRTSLSFYVADFSIVYLFLIRRKPGKARVWSPTIVQFNLLVCYFVFYVTCRHSFQLRMQIEALLYKGNL